MTLQLIGDKWKVLIIRDLLSGTKRFSELMRSVTGITQKVLTSHLRSMEAAGLLTRKIYPEVPPKVEYTLTETGYSLKPIMDSMVDWEPGIKSYRIRFSGRRLDSSGEKALCPMPPCSDRHRAAAVRIHTADFQRNPR